MAENLFIANLMIPFIGICILLIIFFSIISKPQQDYSRKIYTNMLLCCFGILVMEGFQEIFGKKRFVIDIFFFKFSYLIFYTLLAILCYFWTLYNYYWFNNDYSRGKVSALFAAFPVCEVVSLIVNLFTGSIYSINSVGNYARGNFFSFYIGFSYFALLASVFATALISIKRNGKIVKKDFLFFVLFFMFPIIGPMLQYLFPELPVMGISEAIALLIIDYAVQQRAAAKNAIEEARQSADYQQYENSLEKLFSTSQDALCFYHLNLTKNSLSDKRGTSFYISSLLQKDTVDDLFNTITTIISDEKESAEFRNIFNREHLIKIFSDETSYISMGYHRKIENGEIHWVKTCLNMLINPTSGDIEGIIYSLDMDRQKKEEEVITAITERGYDYIALVDTKTKKINYQYTSQKAESSLLLQMADYDEVMKRNILHRFKQNEQDELFRKISFNTVIDSLQKQEEYSTIYSCISS